MNDPGVYCALQIREASCSVADMGGQDSMTESRRGAESKEHSKDSSQRNGIERLIGKPDRSGIVQPKIEICG